MDLWLCQIRYLKYVAYLPIPLFWYNKTIKWTYGFAENLCRKKIHFSGEAAFSRTLEEEKKGGKGEKKRGKKKREREEGLLLLLQVLNALSLKPQHDPAVNL
jgi:hypothetical protein